MSTESEDSVSPKVNGAEASSNGINLAKEDIFNHISHAFTWTDAALRAMGILKATDGYSL